MIPFRTEGRKIQDELDIFLQQVRAAVEIGNYQILDRRSKYLQTLSAVGIIESDVLDDISNLNRNDGLRKEEDQNPAFPGYVWITKKFLHGEMIYIKLKIKTQPQGQLLVMSYHIDNM